jgi:hypothetical protein
MIDEAGHDWQQVHIIGEITLDILLTDEIISAARMVLGYVWNRLIRLK